MVGDPPPTLKPRREAGVFKYPENVGEIADFFDIMSDKDFTPQTAIDNLKISGKPTTAALPNGERKAYPAQNDVISGIELDTVGGQLVQIHLVYTKPIPITIGELVQLVSPGQAPIPPGAVGQLSAPITTAAANIHDPIRSTGPMLDGREKLTVWAAGRTRNGDIILTVAASPSVSYRFTDPRAVSEITFVK